MTDYCVSFPFSEIVELDRPQEDQDIVGIKIKMPKGCVYEDEKGKTEYCPICNHDDVPYCQFLDDDEVGIGVDERPCYCPLIEIKEHTSERTETHSCDNQYCIQNGGDTCDRVHCPIGQKVVIKAETHGDVIYRQAAIDALSLRLMRDVVEPLINELPSVEPETCEGCKHFGKWENEVECGYPSPCTRCKRKTEDNYER